MKSLIMSFLALIIAASSERNLSRPISLLEIPSRIAGGKPATCGQFPYQVGMSANGRCGGALIGSTWVLTTAYCVDGQSSVEVKLGGTDFSKPDVKFTVDKINFIQHEKYESTTKNNNIALIKIPRVKYTNTIQKVKLPKIKVREPKYLGNQVIVSGWGNNKNGTDTRTDLLQYAEMTVISNEACSRVLENIVESKICASPFNGGNICSGDDGGPMVLRDKNILIGVIFLKTKDCESCSPVAFTRVSSYLDWIAEKTGIEC